MHLPTISPELLEPIAIPPELLGDFPGIVPTIPHETTAAALAQFQGGPWAGAPAPNAVTGQIAAPQGAGLPSAPSWLTSGDVSGAFAQLAFEYGLDPSALLPVMAVESGFNPASRGGGGNQYYGLFQVGPQESQGGMYQDTLAAIYNNAGNLPAMAVQEIQSYGNDYLSSLKLDGLQSALASQGLTLSQFPPAVQAAILQAWRFSPGWAASPNNPNNWLHGLAGGNLNISTTPQGAPQAGILGGHGYPTLGTMSGVLGNYLTNQPVFYSSGQVGGVGGGFGYPVR
jgi:Transglycosylase SLT domain